jgi:hypothetical protein
VNKRMKEKMKRDEQERAEFNEFLEAFTRRIADGIITGGFSMIRGTIITALPTYDAMMKKRRRK